MGRFSKFSDDELDILEDALSKYKNYKPNTDTMIEQICKEREIRKENIKPCANCDYAIDSTDGWWCRNKLISVNRIGCCYKICGEYTERNKH